MHIKFHYRNLRPSRRARILLEQEAAKFERHLEASSLLSADIELEPDGNISAHLGLSSSGVYNLHATAKAGSLYQALQNASHKLLRRVLKTKEKAKPSSDRAVRWDQPAMIAVDDDYLLPVDAAYVRSAEAIWGQHRRRAALHI